MLTLSQESDEFVACLNEAKVEYLLVGGYAVAHYGRPRYTGDIDFWVKPDPANAERVVQALKEFGFATLNLTVDDFVNPDLIVQLGYEPNRIDIITSISGVEFDIAYANREVTHSESGQAVAVINVRELIQNKLASGRPIDLDDARRLKKKFPNL